MWFSKRLHPWEERVCTFYYILGKIQEDTSIKLSWRNSKIIYLNILAKRAAHKHKLPWSPSLLVHDHFKWLCVLFWSSYDERPFIHDHNVEVSINMYLIWWLSSIGAQSHWMILCVSALQHVPHKITSRSRELIVYTLPAKFQSHFNNNHFKFNFYFFII